MADSQRPRIFRESRVRNAYTLAAWIGMMPRPDVEALAVHTGCGERGRVEFAVSEANLGRCKILLVTGTYPRERTFERLTRECLRQEYGLNPEIRVYAQVEARHTKAQADWLAAKVSKNGIKSVGVVASPWHTPRAFLTDIAAFRRARISVRDCILIPRPAPWNPDAPVSETGKSAWAKTRGEYDPRILEHGTKGDVATVLEFQTYLIELHKELDRRGLT